MSENQVEIRSVIKFLFLKGKDNMQILKQIHLVYGTDSASICTVEERTKELREGTFSIFDKTKSRRPPITELDEPIAHYMQENPINIEDFEYPINFIKNNADFIMNKRIIQVFEISYNHLHLEFQIEQTFDKMYIKNI